MLKRIRLYTVRVGNVGSFIAAAHDIEQARAIAEAWKIESSLDGRITVKPLTTERAVLTFAK